MSAKYFWQSAALETLLIKEVNKSVRSRMARMKTVLMFEQDINVTEICDYKRLIQIF